MYFAEDNRALLLHCASLCVHASMWTLRQRSRSGELSIFLKLKSIESETEKKPDPTGRHALFAVRRQAGLHWYARNRRGSVALYCASVCALCAARCGACDRRGLARKKYRAGEKAPAQR